MADEGHQVLNAVIKLVISKGLSRKELKTEKAVNSITPYKVFRVLDFGFHAVNSGFHVSGSWKRDSNR